MKIIIVISKDGDALDLAIRLRKEGHNVKIAIQDKDCKKIGDGFGLIKVGDWKKELPWVGNDGLIIFDQSGFGREQDDLRKAGYSVVGGSEGGDRLEFDRYHAQKIFRKHGMKTVPSRHFSSVNEAIEFVKKKKGRWVVKQNGHADKCFSYAGKMPDGSDVIDLLTNYKQFNMRECRSLDLQQRVDGIELAVTRYFNGIDWIGPMMMNIEHKKLFPGGLGPKTSEMGTLMWYDGNASNKLFNETLTKVTPYLRKIKFKGCFDINCIVNEESATPLEATPRFGYPTVNVEAALMLTPWGDFLKAVADGKQYEMKWRKGFGVVVLIAVPPFPYQAVNNKYNPQGLRISFCEKLAEDDWSHIHFSELSRKYHPPLIPPLKGGKNYPSFSLSSDRRAMDGIKLPSPLRGEGEGQGEGDFIISGKSGYVMCVTGVGKTVQDAREKACRLIEKIVIPKMFYRNDIGLKFIERDKALLEKWGYL